MVLGIIWHEIWPWCLHKSGMPKYLYGLGYLEPPMRPLVSPCHAALAASHDASAEG